MIAGVINIFLYMWTTGQLKDNSKVIKILHRCCNRQKRVLPTKVKDEKELESEALYSTMNPEDSNSHGVILREQIAKSKKDGGSQQSCSSSGDEEDGDRNGEDSF